MSLLLAGLIQVAFGGVHFFGAPPAVFAAAWFVSWLLIIVGLAELVRAGVTGRTGPLVTMIGAAGYMLAEGAYLVMVALLGDDVSTVERLTDRLLPLSAVLAAAGMIVAGISAVRRGAWQGWRRFAPLLVGVYPFVAMFSAVLLTGSPNELAIAGWGLAWLTLGVAMRRPARVPSPRADQRVG